MPPRLRQALISLLLMTIAQIASGTTAPSLSFTYPASLAELSPNKYARINDAAYKQLLKVQTLADENTPQEALKTLETLIKRYQRNPYITSLSLRAASSILLANEQYDLAISLITLTITLNSLEDEAVQSQRHLLAQLLFQEEQYKKSIQTLKSWLSKALPEDINASDYYLVALAWYQLDQCKNALKEASHGIKQLKKDDENLLRLTLSCQLNAKDYLSADDTLARLVKLSPADAKYWNQWVSIHLLNNQPQKALAVMEIMADKKQLSTEQQRLRYVGLLQQQDNPQRAAKALETFIKGQQIPDTVKHQQRLAYAWEQAGHIDKALAVFDLSVTARNDEKGFQHYTRLLVMSEQWPQLIKAIETRYGKPGDSWKKQTLTEKTETTLLQLGFAYYEIGKEAQAKEVFEQLTTLSKTGDKTKELAGKWLAFLSNEGQ